MKLPFSLSRFLLCVSFALFASFARPSSAADFQITAIVVATNTPAGLSTNLTVNIGTAVTRAFTNDASAVLATHVQTTNATAATRTNLLSQISSYPIYAIGSSGPQLLVTYSATNTSALEMAAPRNTNITVTFGGNWATVTYITNTFASAAPIMTATNALSAEQRTNAENAVVNYLAPNRATNILPLATAFLARYVDTNTAQTIGGKTFIAPVLQGGRMVNATNLTGTNVALTNVTIHLVSISGLTSLSGIVSALTNGIWTNGIFLNPKMTNGQNYGEPFRSPGGGTASEQFGTSASATTNFATAFGNSAAATGIASSAFGSQAQSSGSGAGAFGNGTFATGAGAFAGGQSSVASGDYSIAIGNEDTAASGTNSIAIGMTTTASGYRAAAFGPGAAGSHDHSTAIGGYDYLGTASGTTTTNQIRLGTANTTVSIPGTTEAVNIDATGKAQFGTITNSTLRGTNVINARLDFTSRANTSLANGYNSGVILGTNVYVKLSGHSAACTNAGWAAEQDGSFHIIEVDNPTSNFTLLDQSGLEATAANRIVTGTADLLSSTNQPVMIQVIYNLSAARWRILSFR